MAFKVTHDKWLQKEHDRIQSIILMPKYWNRAWTDHSLKDELNELGLDYSLPEVQELNDELHKRGDVEDLPEE